MNNATLFVVMGFSGAGKDTVADIITQSTEYPVKNIKFSAPAKRAFEQWYGIPAGSLDDREARVQKVPGENFTYLDALVRAYDAWNIIDPKLTVRPVMREIDALLHAGVSVICTDVRKRAECEELLNYNPVIIHVYGRMEEKRLESDRELWGNLAYFVNHKCEYYEINNSGNYLELMDKVKKVC